MDITERFLSYVKYDTTSDDTKEGCPSTENQFLLADHLVQELHALGVENAYRADNAFVYNPNARDCWLQVNDAEPVRVPSGCLTTL